MNTNNGYINRVQVDVMDRYLLAIDDVIDGMAVCEVHHPTGCNDVYIKQDGSIYVEEGDDLDGYEMVPLADSFLASRFRD